MHWSVGTAAQTTSSHHQTASRSESLAVETHTRSRFPSVSTTICRLRPLTFFSPVVAVVATDFCRLHGLAVDDARRRFRFAPRVPARRPAQGVIDAFPGAILLPLIEVVAHRP